MRLYLLLSALIVLATPAVARAPQENSVVTALTDSAAGWNQGKIGRFMAIYSDAPETSFVTAEGLVRGKSKMATRYREKFSFDDPDKRGKLSFKTLDFRLLDATHALYIGQYLLTYSSGKSATGPTSLVFAKEKTGWKIIADHSS